MNLVMASPAADWADIDYQADWFSGSASGSLADRPCRCANVRDLRDASALEPEASLPKHRPPY